MTNLRNTDEYDEIRHTTEYAIGFNDGYAEGVTSATYACCKACQHDLQREYRDVLPKEHPLENSPFTWSYFGAENDFLGEKYVAEYTDPKHAESDVEFDDGQIAFDLDRPVYVALFGVYGEHKGGEDWNLSADVWDKSRTDLIGCAVIKDWMWEAATGEDTFDKEQILTYLQSETEELVDYLNTQGA